MRKDLFQDYGMARPLSIKEAVYYSGFSRQYLHRLLQSGDISKSSSDSSKIDGNCLLIWISDRFVSRVPGTSVETYSLKGLIKTTGRSRSYVLKMVDANRIERYYIFNKVHFSKEQCDVAMRKEDPLCRK